MHAHMSGSHPRVCMILPFPTHEGEDHRCVTHSARLSGQGREQRNSHRLGLAHRHRSGEHQGHRSLECTCRRRDPRRRRPHVRRPAGCPRWLRRWQPFRRGGTETGDTSLKTAIAQLTSHLESHISVAFEVVDGRGTSFSADFDGGRGMRTCTSGFAAVTNDTGVYGIVTAGHCSNVQRMQGVSLPWVRGYESRRADAQFHEIPTGSDHVLYDDYVCDTSGWWHSVCDVSGDIARGSMQDHYVCHTGKHTGTSCGTVVDISHRPSYYGACRNGSGTGRRINCSSVFVLVEGPSLYSCAGDSGGPWFSYGTAYGIHMGTVNPYNTCYEPVSGAFFSAIDEVESFLDVEILSNGSVTID